MSTTDSEELSILMLLKASLKETAKFSQKSKNKNIFTKRHFNISHSKNNAHEFPEKSGRIFEKEEHFLCLTKAFLKYFLIMYSY